MKAKFTEGEWFVNGYEIQSKTYSIELAKVTVFNEGKANAHLIAAAPDMYKMLELLVLGDSINDTTIDDEVRMLLAKARGVDNT